MCEDGVGGVGKVGAGKVGAGRGGGGGGEEEGGGVGRSAPHAEFFPRAKFQRFRKGVGGRGLATSSVQNTAKNAPRIVFSCFIRGIGKRGTAKGQNLWCGRDFLAPTPSVCQPLFETSEKLLCLQKKYQNAVSWVQREKLSKLNCLPNFFVGKVCARALDFSTRDTIFV